MHDLQPEDVDPERLLRRRIEELKSRVVAATERTRAAMDAGADEIRALIQLIDKAARDNRVLRDMVPLLTPPVLGPNPSVRDLVAALARSKASAQFLEREIAENQRLQEQLRVTQQRKEFYAAIATILGAFDQFPKKASAAAHRLRWKYRAAKVSATLVALGVAALSGIVLANAMESWFQVVIPLYAKVATFLVVFVVEQLVTSPILKRRERRAFEFLLSSVESTAIEMIQDIDEIEGEMLETLTTPANSTLQPTPTRAT